MAGKSNLITIFFGTEYRYSSTNLLSKQHASYGQQHMEPAEIVTIPTINMQCQELNVQTVTE